MVHFSIWKNDQDEEKRLLFLLFLLSFTVRMIYALSNPTLPTIVDAADFDIIAYNISSGNGFGYGQGDLTSWRAPVYPFFLAGIYYVFGHNYWSVWFFESVIGGLLPVFIYLIAKSLFSVEAAIISASICALHPKLIETVNLGLAENIFSVLTAAMILSILTMIRHPHILIFFLTGLLMGFTILCKIILLPYILFIVPVSLYVAPSLRHLLKRYPVTLIAVALVLLPWITRNYSVHDRLVLVNTNGGFTLWYNNNNLSEEGYFWGATAQNDRQKKIDMQIREREKLIQSPESLIRVMTPIVRKHYWNVFNNVGNPALRQEFEHLDEVEADSLFLRKALGYIMTHKIRFLKKSIRSAIKFYHIFDEGARYQWLWGIIFPFTIVGLFFTSHNWREYILLYGLLITIWAVSTVFESSVRYRVPFESFFIMFGAHGMVTIVKNKPRQFLLGFITVLCINLPGILFPENTRFFLRGFLQKIGLDIIPW